MAVNSRTVIRYVFLKYILGIHSKLTSGGFTFSAENRCGIAGEEQSRRELGGESEGAVVCGNYISRGAELSVIAPQRSAN